MATRMDFGTNSLDYETPDRAVFGEGLQPGTLEWNHFQLTRQADFNRWRHHLVVPIKQEDSLRTSNTEPLFSMYRVATRWVRFMLRL